MISDTCAMLADSEHVVNPLGYANVSSTRIGRSGM